MVPASDLVEGLLNNVERPPVYHPQTHEELYAGEALPHFNEVDEGAAIDALVTNRIWRAMGMDPATTLHDVRWGEHFTGDGVDDFVWVFEISGAAPASHYGGYQNARSERQPPMFFPLGGGTLAGVSKPGEIVWSRVYIMGGALHADIGRGTVVALPEEETQRRWQATNPEWPIMHAVLHGVSRDQLMARHKANHVQVVYADPAEMADKGLAAKAAMFDAMGITGHLAGDVAPSAPVSSAPVRSPSRPAHRRAGGLFNVESADRPRALAHDQTRVQHALVQRRVGVVDQADEVFHALLAQADEVLAHGGQRRLGLPGDIVAPTTETFSGMRKPYLCRARSAPRAIWSLPTTSAVNATPDSKICRAPV